MSQRKQRDIGAEQKADAIRFVREVSNLSQAARDLDLTVTALRRWSRRRSTRAAAETAP